ncbi:MAG TPA: HlyD family efflux transporter periplasmic adaptor subunit [Pirellulales bacterium]|nr:HlyD family efflux transporter periplasmic adaptor subunit [Pirellulales bacterium]
MIRLNHSHVPAAVAQPLVATHPRLGRPPRATPRQPRVVELRDCTTLRQELEARPPVFVHAACWLSLTLIVVALVWASLTTASLVVRSTGRVRPVDTPLHIFAPRGTRLDGRVAVVHVHAGDEVHQGAVLLEFDTALLDNEIAGLDRKILACQEELAELDHIAQRLASQYQAAHAKALAELAVGRTEVEQAHQRRQAEVRRAEVDLATKQDQERRTSKLVLTSAVTESQFVEDQAKVCDSEQKLAVAKLPVELGKLTVLEQGVELVEQDSAVHRAELEARRVAKRGEIDTSGKELENLRLQREQAVLRSPIGGVVVQGNPRVGDLVPAGETVFEIARQQGFRFEVELASEDVGLLRTGMPTMIKFDAFDFQRYGTMAGEVSYLSPDSTPADPMQPKRGATFVVKIDLAGQRVARGDYCGQIKLGMGGQAEIVTERRSLLMILLRRVRSSISLS